MRAIILGSLVASILLLVGLMRAAGRASRQEEKLWRQLSEQPGECPIRSRTASRKESGGST